MDALSLLRFQVAGARRDFNGVLSDVTQEMLDWTPPGTANSIAGLVLHTVVGQDRVVMARIQARPILLETWAPRLNVAPDFRLTPENAKLLRVDLGALREYVAAVEAAVDAYLATLHSDADLDRIVEGFRGPVPQGQTLSVMLVTHVFEHTGEISALKGVQGARGYAAS